MSDTPTTDFLLDRDEFFRCRCPEPDRPGWLHRTPIECSPLAPGESIEEWRGRRYEGRLSIPWALSSWNRQIAEDGYVLLGSESVAAEVSELPDGSDGYRWSGHRWDTIVLGSRELSHCCI